MLRVASNVFDNAAATHEPNKQRHGPRPTLQDATEVDNRISATQEVLEQVLLQAEEATKLRNPRRPASGIQSVSPWRFLCSASSGSQLERTAPRACPRQDEAPNATQDLALPRQTRPGRSCASTENVTDARRKHSSSEGKCVIAAS